MNKAEEIRRLLNEIHPKVEVIHMGVVDSIQSETCTVTLSSGLEYPDVRLRQAVNESPNFLVLTPKIGATVTMISLSGDLSDLMILSASEYNSIEYNQDGLQFKLDAEEGKLQFKKGNSSLYGLFESLGQIIKGIQVGTPQGTSSTPLPPTIQAVNQFEIEFKSILKK